MATHIDLFQVFLKAWDSVWNEVQEHPELLLWRETHIHALLAHRIWSHLEKADGLKPWEDLIVFIDDNTAIKSSGTIPWSHLFSRLRPDIALRPVKGRLEGEDHRGLAIEIKIVRSIMQRNIKSGNRYAIDTKKQKEKLKDDWFKLEDIVDLSDGSLYRGVLCVLHIHSKSFGDISQQSFELQWSDAETLERDELVIRRQVQLLDSLYPDDPLAGITSERKAKTEYLYK